MEKDQDADHGTIMTIKGAATVLGVAPSTLHRWLNVGIIQGEQLTPGAPWRIRVTKELIARFSDKAEDGFLTMQEATRKLGVTRQTLLQRVKRGEIEARHITKGRQKGIRIKMIEHQSTFFDLTS